MKELKSCKVIPGESVSTQHRMLVNEDEGCQEKDESKRKNYTKSMVGVDPGRAERCIHLEGEGTSLLIGRRRKRNKLEGDIF